MNASDHRRASKNRRHASRVSRMSRFAPCYFVVPGNLAARVRLEFPILSLNPRLAQCWWQSRPDDEFETYRVPISSSSSGGDWELDEVPAVRDPTHVAQIGWGTTCAWRLLISSAFLNSPSTGRYRDTVRSEMTIPSLNNSPWIRAPQRQFSAAKRRIKPRHSESIRGVPGRRERRRQHRWNLSFAKTKSAGFGPRRL
jgi:hypothetical protein